MTDDGDGFGFWVGVFVALAISSVLLGISLLAVVLSGVLS